MVTLIFIIIVVALVAVFSVQNAATVSVAFFAWHFEASLAIIILLSVIAGVLIGMVVLSSVRLARSSRRDKDQKKATGSGAQ